MAKIYKKHGSEFRLKVALEAIKGKRTITELCQEFGVASSQISTWKKQVEEGAHALFDGKRPKNHQEEVDKLHRVIGKITAERDFLERVLKR